MLPMLSGTNISGLRLISFAGKVASLDCPPLAMTLSHVHMAMVAHI